MPYGKRDLTDAENPFLGLWHTDRNQDKVITIKLTQE